MMQRPPAEEVIHGLKTTSANIRALAQAGYDRTEISLHLRACIGMSARFSSMLQQLRQ